MKKALVVEIIAMLFIILFAYAAINKLWDIEKFRIQIGQSPPLTSIAPIAAWLIPIVEIFIAILLCIPRIRLVGLYASFSLMVMFTTYIIVILSFSEHIPCACGGVLDTLGWRDHLIFNIGFVLLGLAGILLSGKRETMQSTIA
jgi:hypothetical protein